MSNDFVSAVTNHARGGGMYRHARHRIFNAAARSKRQATYEPNRFLRDGLLKLRKGEWFALSFDDKDWEALDVIRADKTGYWQACYFPLVLDYITANAPRVRTLQKINLTVGAAMFRDDGEAVFAAISSLCPEDEQSLFYFRALAAQFSFDTDRLIDLLKKRLKTDWLRKRYLYPLVFQAVNSPSESYLEDFLSLVVTGEESQSESSTLRLLLRDDLIEDSDLAFKSYVALLCHPYDACEIVLNCVEAELCSCGSLSPILLDALNRLHKEVPSARTEHLWRLGSLKSITYEADVSGRKLQTTYGLDETTADVLEHIASLRPSPRQAPPDLSKPLATLHRMRHEKYPAPDDFNYLVHSGRSWWFCEAGRLLNSLITSLYLIARRGPSYEVRDLLRLTGFFGAVTPFIISSPSSSQLRSAAFSQLWQDRSIDEIENDTQRLLQPPEAHDDRIWIKSAQWVLRDLQRGVKLAQWLATVRKEIRVNPAYLTGINWEWLESVIKKVRLAPFIGNTDGVYALLLFKIEERDWMSSALRTAFEPFVQDKTLPEVVDWLIAEYGSEATAFARYLLEIDDLLLLGLAPNRTAALAGRIYALEQCIRRFRYNHLLPQSLFEQEWNTLNSALLLTSVNAGQFEVPWSVFIRDAASKQFDLYTAAHSLDPSDEVSPILSEGRSSLPYRFRNETIVVYNYPGRLAPTISLVIAIVEDFLAHPAFGLEVILSTRFRHDNMRREFAALLEAMETMHIQGTWKDERKDIIREIETPLLKAIDRWLERRMHTQRPGKPEALFDIIPRSTEMLDLANRLRLSEGVDAVISEIVEWMKIRLELQLPLARKTFELEVPAALEAVLTSEKNRLLSEREYRAPSIDRIAAALHTALNRRVAELSEWFKGYPEAGRHPLTFNEIKLAADGVFESSKDRRGYLTYFAGSGDLNWNVSSDKVRSNFDLLREVFAAALKHTAPLPARVRITFWSQDGLKGLRFSNLTPHEEHSGTNEIAGDPYVSLDDVIFREGNSGLSKIAALAATAVGHPVKIWAVRRSKSFHLYVPLALDDGEFSWPTNQPTSS